MKMLQLDCLYNFHLGKYMRMNSQVNNSSVSLQSDYPLSREIHTNG